MILFKRYIELIRHGTGGYYNDNGLYVDASTIQRTIAANVQPANNKDMELLPDGARTIRAIKVFSDEVLYSSQQAFWRFTELHYSQTINRAFRTSTLFWRSTELHYSQT